MYETLIIGYNFLYIRRLEFLENCNMLHVNHSFPCHSLIILTGYACLLRQPTSSILIVQGSFNLQFSKYLLHNAR